MSKILGEKWSWVLFIKGHIEYLLYTLLELGTLTVFSLIRKHLNTIYLRYAHVGEYTPKRNVQYSK